MATSPSGYPPQLSLVQCLTEPTIPEMVKNAAGKDETFWMRETTWFPKKKQSAHNPEKSSSRNLRFSHHHQHGFAHIFPIVKT